MEKKIILIPGEIVFRSQKIILISREILFLPQEK